MKQSIIKLASVLLLLSILVSCIVSCNKEKTPEHIDYAAELKLDLNSDSAKAIDVTVKSYIDGDTTHFYVPTSISETGVLKARYIAINTPESTGKIEEYGKKASNFTKEKLSSATSIIIEALAANVSTTSLDVLGSEDYKKNGDKTVKALVEELVKLQKDTSEDQNLKDLKKESSV